MKKIRLVQPGALPPETQESPPQTKKDGFSEEVLVSLRRIIRAVDIYSRRLLQRTGLTGPQLSVLSEIQKHEEISISGLARSAHLSHPTVNGILHRLEKRGLIVRQKNSQDKRATIINITVAGKDVLLNCPSPLHDKLSTEFSRLQEWERTMILSSMQRVVSMMEMQEETKDSSPIVASGRLDATAESVMSYLDEADKGEQPEKTGEKASQEK